MAVATDWVNGGLFIPSHVTPTPADFVGVALLMFDRPLEQAGGVAWHGGHIVWQIETISFPQSSSHFGMPYANGILVQISAGIGRFGTIVPDGNIYLGVSRLTGTVPGSFFAINTPYDFTDITVFDAIGTIPFASLPLTTVLAGFPAISTPWPVFTLDRPLAIAPGAGLLRFVLFTDYSFGATDISNFAMGFPNVAPVGGTYTHLSDDMNLFDSENEDRQWWSDGGGTGHKWFNNLGFVSSLHHARSFGQVIG